MDRVELAKAYRNIGVAYIQAAEVLEGGVVADEAPAPTPIATGTGLQPLRPLNGAPVPQAAPQTQGGILEACPEHGSQWLAGRYGLYCPAKGTDPAWTNRKGYCTITPESAAQYQAIHAQR